MRKLLMILLLLASGCGTTRTADIVLLRPAGPYAVGTRLFDLSNALRPDTFAPRPGPRRILIQLYYPAARRGPCTADAYMDAPTAEAAIGNGPLPPGFAGRIRTHSCTGAPVAPEAGPLPVILLSHGLGASRFSYRALAEELASHGYAVAAIQHTYGSVVTLFPDGTVAPWNEAAFESPAELSRFLEEWVRDAREVLDHLSAPPYPPQLDLSRVGYAGHSFGGATAVLTALRDPRVRAVCKLDGRLFDPIPRPVRLPVPLLVLLNEASTRRADYTTGDNLFLAHIRGSTHTTFTDTPWLDQAFHVPDELAAKLSKPLSPSEGLQLTRAAVTAFFDCILRGDAERCQALRARIQPFDAP